MGTGPGRGSRPESAQYAAGSSWPVSCSASSAPRRSPKAAGIFRCRTRNRQRPSAYALDTLRDDETIARLATGIKRFTLPDEFNPIKIYQEIADEPADRPGRGRARRSWRRSSRTAASSTARPSISSEARTPTATRTAAKSPAARPDPRHLGPVRAASMTQPAGTGATVDFRFRNGRRVRLRGPRDPRRQAAERRQGVHRVRARAARLAEDRHQRHRLPPGDLNQQQYLGRVVASWDLDLDPRPGHFDRRITVTTPLQKAGAYLLTARMEGGNTSQIVVWLDDTVIVKKPMAEEGLLLRRPTPGPASRLPGPTSSSSAGGWFNVDGKNEFQRRDQDARAQDRRRRPGPDSHRQT